MASSQSSDNNTNVVVKKTRAQQKAESALLAERINIVNEIKFEINDTITEYNKNLANSNRDIILMDYIKDVHNKYFQFIDIDFMNDFMNIVSHNNIWVNSDMMYKYGIMNDVGKKSTRIKQFLNENGFQEGKHFRGEQLLTPAPRGGNTYQITYEINPIVFKIALMRSQKTFKFAIYFIYLELCVYYYNQFQIVFKESTIMQIKNNTEVMLAELRNSYNKAEEARRRAEDNQNKLLEKIDKLEKKLEEKSKKILDKQEKLDRRTELLVNKSSRSVMQTRYKCDQEHIVILHNPNDNEYNYYAMCRLHSTCEEAKKTLIGYEEKFRMTDVANCKKFFKYIKKKMNLKAYNRKFYSRLSPSRLKKEFEELYSKYRYDDIEEELFSDTSSDDSE